MTARKIDDLSLRWKITGNLLLIFLLVLANVVGVLFFLQEQDQDGSVINDAGRQRMLVQKMMIEAHRIEMGEDDHRDDLATAAAEYNRTLTTFIEGNESAGISPAPPEVRRQLLTLREQWEPFSERVDTIEQTSPDEPAFQDALTYIQTNEPTLLAETDGVVRSYEASFERKIVRLKQFLLAMVALDALSVALLYVFASRRIIDPIKRIAEDADAIANGQLDRTIRSVESADEVGTLCRSVREMKEQLVASLREARGFEQAVEQAGHTIYLTDTDGTIEYVNPAFEEQTGYSEAEAIGREPNIVKSGEQDDAFYRDLWETVLAGRTWDGEVINRRKDGEIYHVKQTIAPVIDEDGAIERFVAVNDDITELKRLQAALEAERNRFAALFENIPEPVVHVEFVANEPIIRAVNPAFEKMFGFAKESIVGESLDDVIMPPEASAEAMALNERCWQGDEIKTEVRRNTADGIRDFLLRVARIDEGERGVWCYAIYTDITQRKHREHELERQNEQLERFASVVSHDLRNPLNVAQGRLELAADDCESDHFEPIRNALDRMNVLIEDILTLAREGKTVDSVEAVALDRIVREAWATTGEHELDATLVIPDDGLGTIDADRRRLLQLFENLFRNALEHAGPDVTVAVGRIGDRGFFVEDDGPGIPPDERERVFESGYSTTADGTGFGLNIVEAIVEAHHWEVAITEGRGGGARFEITGDGLLR